MLKFVSLVLALSLSGCASLPRSLLLGGSSGAAVGGFAGSLAYPGPKGQQAPQNILIGAGIGLGIGLLSSYLLHNHVESRTDEVRGGSEPKTYFGDLPPNPFELSPNQSARKAGKK